MLDDPRATRRRQQACAGRQVQAARAVAAGPYRVDCRLAIRYIGVDGQFAQGIGEAADLVGRFALRP